jgi:hypothetical protein
MGRRVQVLPVLLILLVCGIVHSQDVVKLDPGDSHTNETNTAAYVIGIEKAKSLLSSEVSLDICRQRVDLLTERAAVLQERVSVADSATALSRVRAEYLYAKLLETDKLLEQERIARTRFWNSRTFWFIVGALTASAVVSAD